MPHEIEFVLISAAPSFTAVILTLKIFAIKDGREFL